MMDRRRLLCVAVCIFALSHHTSAQQDAPSATEQDSTSEEGPPGHTGTSPPKITKQSESYYVVLPRIPTKIECVATGTPEPTYRWQKDGVDVVMGGGFSLNGGNLVVRRPSDWTNGLYRCFASNQYGVAISNKINFTFAFTDPFRETEPETFTFDEGNVATIPCNQQASVPVSSVFWTDDSNPGNDIVLDNRVSVDPNFNLHFSNIKLSDMGNYQCNVKNDKLRIQLLSPIKEVVVRAVENIDVRPATLVYSPPSTVQAFRTEKLRLKCMAEGYPTPTISWAKQDESLPASRTSYESYGQELVISDVVEADAGMYTCTAENGGGAPTSATTTVIVQSTPYWLNKPEDINIFINDPGELICEAGGIPLPKVTWLVNGVPTDDAESNPRITITEGQGGGHVEYSNAQTEDSAVFQCVAANEHGEITASGFVNVESIPAQIFHAPDLNVNSIEGKRIDLTCAGQGSPKPVVTWIFKGSPIVMDGMKYDIVEHGNSFVTTSTLTVMVVSVNDTGTYTCSIENGFWPVTGDSRVTVRSHTETSPPKITKQSESYYVVLPRVPTEIECVATGTPEPTYRWEKDGVDVVMEGGFSLNGGNLVVRRPGEMTNGLYRCFASNQYGVAVSNKITFTVAFADPFREMEPETFTFDEGSMASIPCNQPASVPVPSVFWTDDTNPGNDIMLNNRVSVDPNFNLRFSNIKLSDTGNYQCNVKIDKLRIQLLSPIKEVVVTAVKNIAKRPATLVYNPPSTVQAFRTEKLRLKCMAEGYPTPTIAWAKQDESLPASRMSYESYGQELVISDIVEADAGMYTCTAENGRGAPTSATTTVIVQSTPYWVNKPEDISIVINDPGELICEAGGIPLPKVTWLVNGEPSADAESNPRITITEGQGGGRVDYSNAQTEDSAVFQCVAANEHGEIAASGFVNVESIPAQITDAPDRSFSIIEGKGIDLTCTGQGSPKPIITWIFKGSQIVMDGMKYDIVEHGNSFVTTSTLTVMGVSVNDTGSYTCSIENGFGAVTGNYRVTVRSHTRTLPPKITKQSESYYVVLPRVPTEIECVATGTPEPTYRWEKDGVDVVMEGGFSLNGGNLAVRRPSEWTNGLYRCFASNQYGVAISNKINFTVAFVDPFREMEPETFTFEEGSVATIPCNQQASVPVPSVFWTDDSNLCNKIKLNNRVSVDPNFNLRFSNIELSDMRNYQCNVRNDKLRIQLLSPTKEVVVRAVKNIAKRPATLVYSPPSTVQAFRTEKLRLKCMAEGYPTPTISWAKQDESLPASRMSYESYGQELVISDVTEGDAGMYTCTAENGLGAPTSATTTVIVQSTPYWLNKPEDINIVINDPGELICEAEGIPLPKVTWMINGVPSADAELNPHITITEGQGGGRVEYSNAQMEDSAVFQCVATNEHGEIAASGFVNVESIPAQTDASGLSFNAIEGKRIDLTCAGQGFPKPIITWIFKGSPIVMDGMKYDIVEHGSSLITTSTLTVTEVSVNDTGTYTCSIENVFGTVTENYRVTVRKGTKIIVGPEDEVPVQKGDTAIIACEVDHDAALGVTVTWSRDVGSGWDDLDLTIPGGRFKHAKTGSDNLKILETVVEDTGTYMCKAVTVMDKAAASTQLVIQS